LVIKHRIPVPIKSRELNTSVPVFPPFLFDVAVKKTVNAKIMRNKEKIRRDTPRITMK
jgi:hypothetical protein